jgi:hypothetical protein
VRLAGPAPTIATLRPVAVVTRPSAAISSILSWGTLSMAKRFSQRIAMGSPRLPMEQAVSQRWVQTRPQTCPKGMVR